MSFDLAKLKQQRSEIEKEIAVLSAKEKELENKMGEIKNQLIGMGYSEDFLNDEDAIKEEMEKLQEQINKLQQELKEEEDE